MNVPDTCDLCGCEPTVDPVTDVIDLTQVCGITLGKKLDREHWLCSKCSNEFGGGTDCQDSDGITDSEHTPNEPMCNCGTCFNKRAAEADELTMLRSLAYKFSLLYTATCCLSDGEVDMGIDPYGEARGAAEELVSGTNLSEAQQNYLIEL